MFGVGFLKISAAYLTTWNLGGDSKHWHTTSVTIVKPINQMHVARPAASRANGKPPGKVCFSAGGKRCRLFMPDMNPLQLFLFSNRVCKPIEGVTRKPIDAFHSRLSECIYHQLRDVFSHDQHPPCFLSSIRNLTADILKLSKIEIPEL